MKNILEYQKEYWTNQAMINEDFESSILRKIKDQINDITKANIEYNSNNNWGNRTTNTTFKSLFSNKDVKWNEIKDEDFKKYSNDDKEGLKLARAITSSRENSFYGMIITIAESNSDVLSGIISRRWSTNVYLSLLANYGFNTKDFRPSELSSYLTKEFYILDLSKFSSSDKKNERGNARNWESVIDKKNRENIYQRIAEKNKERYKQYSAKMKAERDANDGIPDKVNEYVEKVLALTTDMSKNPTKYIKYEYEVGYILDLLNGEKHWIAPRTYKDKGYYSGTDGLLTAFKDYMKTKLSMAKGDSYDHEKREYEAAKERIEKIFKNIDEKLEKIKPAA